MRERLLTGYALVTCKLRLEIKCGFCGATNVEESCFYAGTKLLYFLPEGWKMLDDDPVCPAHEVHVHSQEPVEDR